MNNSEFPSPETDWQNDAHDEQIGNALKVASMPTCPSGLHQRVQNRVTRLRFEAIRTRAMLTAGLLAGCLLCGTYLSKWNRNNQVNSDHTESPSDWAQVSDAEFESLFDPPAFTVVRFVEVQQNALLGSLDQQEPKNAIE